MSGRIVRARRQHAGDRAETDRAPARRPRTKFEKPPLRLLTTTLWEYPSQHYGDEEQGDKRYIGATPSWVIWQLLSRYTREGDLVVDPMAGSGTTLDVARDLNRRALGYDLAASPERRKDVFRADARKLPIEDAKADFVFIDPPYSTHVEYSDDPACIGKLDAADPGRAYYSAMERVFREAHRALKNRRYLAVYVSDSWKKRKGTDGPDRGRGPGAKPPPSFMPIGFELFDILRTMFTPVDIVCVVRHNAKLKKGNWRKAAEDGNFFLRGFNYCMIMKKED